MKDESIMAHLAAIFDRSADGLITCDADGKNLKLNRSAEILNRVKVSEVLGKIKLGCYDLSDYKGMDENFDFPEG